ncbi:hypothetical protein TRFO_14579 [Tritrichomonas foetus]|uniref:KATNIP domain-containing protein n=1 Tax=Tritrichomonas foetus TaxID=1144522 RepID=A0A1J4KZ17_9EUKA|nr:hypothetical protein TRFO_14579 [Tritrichomonas foetus]|eukprot:OHT14940.1 hypothetical protein TRFO_14579 [Tritrichomonas foetus]
MAGVISMNSKQNLLSYKSTRDMSKILNPQAKIKTPGIQKPKNQLDTVFGSHSVHSIPPSFSFRDFQKKLPHAQIKLDNNLKNHYGVNSTLSLSRPVCGKMITVQILSNHGSNSKISLSSIVLLDEKRRQIEIKAISSVPVLSNPKNLENLINTNLLKDDLEVFNMDWPLPQQYESLSIIITIDQGNHPKYVRIWNSKNSDDSSTKNVIILNGVKQIGSGEIPKGFGVDIEIQQEQGMEQSNSTLLLQELFPSLMPEKKLEDSFGGYPFQNTQKISLEILSTYCDEKYIGINGIDFYNDNYQKLIDLDIKDIIVENCSMVQNHSALTRCSKHSVNDHDMFLAETNWTQRPIINFVFRNKVRLSKIVIWNWNAEKRNLKFGIKSLILRADDKLFFAGTVRLANGRIYGMEYCSTEIWLTDMKSIRDYENYRDD